MWQLLGASFNKLTPHYSHVMAGYGRSMVTLRQRLCDKIRAIMVHKGLLRAITLHYELSLAIMGYYSPLLALTAYYKLLQQ